MQKAVVTFEGATVGEQDVNAVYGKSPPCAWAASASEETFNGSNYRPCERRKVTIGKGALAKTATSRAHVDRLLDPRYTPVSLETISRAATFMGKRLQFTLRDAAPRAARHAARRKVAV